MGTQIRSEGDNERGSHYKDPKNDSRRKTDDRDTVADVGDPCITPSKKMGKAERGRSFDAQNAIASLLIASLQIGGHQCKMSVIDNVYPRKSTSGCIKRLLEDYYESL